MQMDETLLGVSERVRNFAVIYLVDITQVPDFNKVSAQPVLGGTWASNAGGSQESAAFPPRVLPEVSSVV